MGSSIIINPYKLPYDPGMMTFDGSTGYYNKLNFTAIGNKVAVVMRFNIASFSGGSAYTLLQVADTQFRAIVQVISNDHATATVRNKLQVKTLNSAGTKICSLYSINDMSDSIDHMLLYSFDGDAGNAVFRIDGVNGDDTGHALRTAPTTGTLEATALTDIGIGADQAGNNKTAGNIGFCGYRDAYLTNYSDFMYGSTPRELDTTTWGEWGAQPGVFAITGKLDTDNLGSYGAFTKNGTITGPF